MDHNIIPPVGASLVPLIDPTTQAVVDASATLARLNDEVADLMAEMAPSTSTAIVPAAGHDPEAARSKMVHVRSAVMRKQAEIQSAQEALRSALDRQRDQAMQMMAPMKKMIAQLTEGIEAVNLFLGTDERIVTLRDGERAPQNTEIVIRQLVLAMDEECALAAGEGGIDARSIDEFDAWLLADPAHLEQVAPEPKGIVALMPRAKSRDYGDPWVNESMDALNKQTYFLIRNGDAIFRTTVPDFRVGRHLIPPRDQFTSMFVTRERNWDTGEYATVPMTPGSHAWRQAEEKADARHRHHMKVALLLQGLAERTTVLHPLPKPTISVLQPQDYESGLIRVVTDAELAIGIGRKPFQEWLRDLNAELRPGMRIIGSFRGEAWSDVNRCSESGDRVSSYRHSRLHPTNADTPDSLSIHTIKERVERNGLKFTYARTRWGYEHGDWGNWGEWPSKTAASCIVYPDDRFIIPIDLVTVSEIESYLSARTERHAYASMFPVLQAALKILRAEQEQEAPFRMLIVGEIMRVHDIDRESAESSVDELVRIWKLANRHHRALIVDGAEGKALEAIVADFGRRRQIIAASTGQVATLLTAHPDAVFVGRRSDNTFCVLAPANERNIYVHEHIYSAARLKLTETREWRTVEGRHLKMLCLHTSDRWTKWARNASPFEHLTDPEVDQLVAELIERSVPHDINVGAIEMRFDRPELITWELVAVPSRDADRPATGAREHGSTRDRKWEWKRNPDRSVELLGSYKTWSSTYSRISWPWDQKRTDRVVVYRNQELLADLDEAVVGVGAIEVVAKQIETVVDRWLSKVVAAFNAVVESEAYETFLKDFTDPNLWEGHRKTLRLDTFEWNVRMSLADLGRHLLEHGVTADELQHMSVQEAIDTAGEIVGFVPAIFAEAVALSARIRQLSTKTGT